ncbi:hypothetical protein IMZ48_35150 [Candidatus Bathyarchaeota archaeon]|nr:hypothetical protein [Candidatus Bathyarchaeota archaeon]
MAFHLLTSASKTPSKNREPVHALVNSGRHASSLFANPGTTSSSTVNVTVLASDAGPKENYMDQIELNSKQRMRSLWKSWVKFHPRDL